MVSLLLVFTPILSRNVDYVGVAWLSMLAGVPITNVAYRGGSQAVTDLAG